MNRKWRWFLPGYLLALPMTIIGVLLSSIVYRAHHYEWRDGVLTCIGGERRDESTRLWGAPGAQTLGFLVIYANRRELERADLRVHENVHVWQGFVGGPLFALAYGAFFLWYYLTPDDDELPGWKDDYHRNPFEEAAYHRQNLYRAGRLPDAWGAR